MAGAAEDSAGLAAADVSASSMGATKCRFFENEFPEVDECVMVRVESIAEMGAYVRLLEYGGIEGMVLLSELSRRRIRSINKLLRVNTNEVVMVTRVDREKGYIDLSKRRVSSEERTVAETRFTEAKAVRDAGVSGSWEHWPWRAAGRQAMPPPPALHTATPSSRRSKASSCTRQRRPSSPWRTCAGASPGPSPRRTLQPTRPSPSQPSACRCTACPRCVAHTPPARVAFVRPAQQA